MAVISTVCRLADLEGTGAVVVYLADNAMRFLAPDLSTSLAPVVGVILLTKAVFCIRQRLQRATI